MSFINEIKTILRLDDKDWKKALSSISEAEKTYVKESKKNTEALINTKQTLSSLEQKKAKELEEINKQIAKAEENKTKAIENGDKALITSMNKRLTLYKQQKREVESNSRIEIDQSKQSIKQIQETISTQDKYNKLLQIAKTNHQEVLEPINKHNTSLSNLANTTIRYLRWAGTIAGVFYAGQRAWDLTIGKGIEVNKIIENNTYGIAALISANTQMVDSLGNTLSPMEKFIKGQEHSKKVIAELRTESTKTAATFPQLLEIFQQGIGKTLSLGSAFGATTQDIEKNTIKLASRMSNFANAIGMPMDRVKEEMRSLVSGNASTDSLISTIIFGSPGAANSAIREAEGKLNGIADLLDKKFKPFDILAETKTFDKSVLAIQDSWSRAMGDMVEKSGAFKDITNMFYDMASAIGKDTDATVKKFDEMYQSAKDVGNQIKRVADLLYEPVGFIAGMYAASVAVKALSLAIANNPITALATGIIAASEATKQYIETMQRGGQSVDEWNKSIAAQNDKWSSPEETEKRIQANLKEVQTKINGAIKTEEQWKKLYESGKVSEDQYNKVLSLKQKTIAENENLVSSYTSALTDMSGYSNAKKQADEIVKGQKQAGDLLANYKDYTEEIKKDAEEVLKSKGKEFELQDEITKKTKEKAELEKILKIQIEQQAKATALEGKENAFIAAKIEETKKGILNKDTLISLKQKEINEEYSKKSKITIAESDKIVKDNIKLSEQAGVRAEINAILNGTYNTETYMVDVARRKVEAAIEEYQIIDAKLAAEKDGYQRKLYQIELDKDLRDVLVSQLEYEEKITKLQEKQNSFSTYKKYITTTGLDQDSANQLVEGLKIAYAGDESSLADIEKFTENLQKQLDKKDLTVNIKFQGFDDLSEGIASVANSYQDMRDAQAKYDKESKSLIDNPIALKQAQIDLQDATMSSYSNMLGAMANFYDEDDSRREKQLELQKIMNATKMAMQLAELAQTITVETAKGQLLGTNALIAQLQLPFPANIPAYAMVASMLASLGIMVGGSTKTSTSSDAFSSMKENTGTGSVLGDTEKQTESIVKALSLLEDFAQPQYRTLQSMNEYLKNISDSIGGVTSLLIQQGGFAFGKGASEFDTGYKNNLDWGNSSKGGALLLQPINSLISQIPIIGDINKMFGNLMGSIMGGLFGKTSVSQALTDSGIYFADTLLSSAIKEFNGQAYQTISTTVSKKSWFSKSSSTSISSYFTDLDSETERQFSLVLDNLYNTVLVSGEALDKSSSEIEKQLNQFVVSIGKISLKGKTGDEIQSQLTSVFGKIGDDLTKTVFPLLTPFQKLGEGMFETLVRVSTGMEEAEYYINRLGKSFNDLTYTDILNPQGNVGFEALLQSIIKTDSSLYGLDNNLLQIISSLDSTAEELYGAYTALDTLRESLKFLKLDTDAISFASIRGAGSIEALSGGISSYIENFLTDEEKTAYQTTLLQKEFAKLNVAMPSSKTAFTSLIQSLDLSSESGQELYGRLIILSESFATVSDSAEESLKTIEESLKTLVDSGFTKFTDSLKSLFDLANELAASTQTTIQNLKYGNESDNAEQLIRFNQLLKDFEVSRNTTNTEKTKSIYNEILSLSGTIGSDSQYKQDILGKLNTNLVGFNADKDIIRVSIVDGLGTLLNLNQEQVTQLKTVAGDGKVTTDELKSINGLTQTQKDGIVEFANNSNYFSTEATLSNLEEYSKLQLDAYRASVAEETVGLSKSTLTYGDYIGKQEQIDIAKLLGVSFESAKPLIEQLQGLSLVGNKTDYYNKINEIVGFNTGTGAYNENTYSLIERLSSYLPTGGSRWSSYSSLGALGNVSISSQNVKAQNEAKEKAKLEAQKQYDYEMSIWNQNLSNAQIQANNYLSGGVNSQGGSEWSKFTGLDYAQAVNQVNNNSGFWGQYMQFMNPYLELLKKVELAKSIPQPILKGYAVGGYTGDGAKYDVAGLVHKGEYVINQEKMKSLGGQESVRQIVGGSLQKSLEFLSVINSKTLGKLDIISQNFIELLKATKEQTLILEASYSAMRDIKGNTAP